MLWESSILSSMRFWPGQFLFALIACIGLILQKKSFSEIIRGTVMTAVGFFILSTGTGLITGSSIDGISTAFNTIVPRAVESKTVDIGTMYGTEIGIVMIAAFAINCSSRASHAGNPFS